MSRTSSTNLAIIGIDLAKRVFHVHGAAADGTVLFRKKLSRSKVLPFFSGQLPCIVAMEACASAHYWAREFAKVGHTIKMIPPIYVKPFVKRQKNDVNDAEAIVEAASRPTMTFVAHKTEEQQARAMAFRARDVLVHQRTQLINSLRGLLAEFGVVAPLGRANIKILCDELHDPRSTLPAEVIEVGQLMLDQIDRCQDKAKALEQKNRQIAKTDINAKRLMTIPGVGPVTAMAIQAFAPDLKTFENGRHFSAWLGLVPQQKSTGGRSILGRTSKMGQRDIRRLLVIGATSVIKAVTIKGATPGTWLARMLASKPKKLVAFALANKMARMIWAVTIKEEGYRKPELLRQSHVAAAMAG